MTVSGRGICCESEQRRFTRGRLTDLWVGWRGRRRRTVRVRRLRGSVVTTVGTESGMEGSTVSSLMSTTGGTTVSRNYESGVPRRLIGGIVLGRVGSIGRRVSAYPTAEASLLSRCGAECTVFRRCTPTVVSTRRMRGRLARRFSSMVTAKGGKRVVGTIVPRFGNGTSKGIVGRIITGLYTGWRGAWRRSCLRY